MADEGQPKGVRSLLTSGGGRRVNVTRTNPGSEGSTSSSSSSGSSSNAGSSSSAGTSSGVQSGGTELADVGLSGQEVDTTPEVLSDLEAIPPATSSELPSKRPSQQVTRRVSTMPLAVLLPKLSELSQLRLLRDSLEKRYRELQHSRATTVGEISREQLAEESMLSQLAQWLNVGDGEEVDER